MDIDALVVHLADARYDDAIRRGANGEVTTLLNEAESGRTHFVDIDADDFMDVISGETLTAAQEGRIQNYLVGKTMVATSRAPVRQWLQANLSAGALTQLIALATESSSYSMRAGSVRASLADVRKAVLRIPKSLVVATGQLPLVT